MAPILAAIGSVGSFMAANAGTIGSLLAAGGTIYSGIQNQQAANTQAKQMQRKGEQEVAIAQRKAIASRREKQQALGRAQAVAAASGGGTGDTVSDIMSGIERQGEYNALTDMYNGNVLRTDLYKEANATRKAGAQGLISSLFSAGSTIYSDYGQRQRAKQYYDYQMGA